MNNIISKTNSEIIIHSKRKDLSSFKKKNVKIFSSIDKCLDEKPDVGLITNETIYHVPTAKKLAEAGLDLFLEKPLSNSMKSVNELLNIIKRKNLITLMGCNLRFHTCIKEIKSLIEKQKIGKVISVQVECGAYLPDWHPYENYSNSYAARDDLGGGIVLTCIHEIDYLYWFFGKVDDVYSFTEKLTDLQIDVEDYSGSLLKFKNKIIAELHLDYFQKPSVRSCKIIGTKGQITWNWENNHVQIFKNKYKKWVTKNIEKKFDRNKMFVDELQYFLKCVKKRKIPMNSIIDGLEPQKIALAIKKSSKCGKKIRMK